MICVEGFRPMQEKLDIKLLVLFVLWAGIVAFRLLTFIIPTEAEKPSIGAPVATVKHGRPSLKLEKRSISVMDPVPTPIIRSQFSGRFRTISPRVASSKPVCFRIRTRLSIPASRRSFSQRSPAILKVISSFW